MKHKEPKDLGIKVGTEEEAMWTTVKKGLEQTIKSLEKELIVNKAFWETASQRAEQEKIKEAT